jgi:hypothetical protein
MMKCLELTASANDAEALAAMRAANKIREELGLKWAATISSPSPFDYDWEAPPARNPQQEADDAARAASYEKAKYEAHLKEQQEAREFADRRARAKERREKEEFRTRFPELQDDEGYS